MSTTVCTFFVHKKAILKTRCDGGDHSHQQKVDKKSMCGLEVPCHLVTAYNRHKDLTFGFQDKILRPQVVCVKKVKMVLLVTEATLMGSRSIFTPFLSMLL